MESYREGFKEGVIFLFYKDDTILIEHRPTTSGTETFIPNGTIEDKDKGKNEDYRIEAMKREAHEEMNVKITEFDYLTELKVKEIGVWFYCYVVTKWEGDIPDYTLEEGKRFADLEWINLYQYRDYFTFQSALYICEELIEYVTKKNIGEEHINSEYSK